MAHFDVDHIHTQVDKKEKIRIIEIVPRGQTVDNWTEIITIQAFGKKKYPPPSEAAKSMKQMLLARCPNLVWNDIETKDQDILYEWRIENCASDPDQSQIGRFLATKDTVFHASYCAKGKQIAPEERQEWISRLQSAKVVK